MHFLFVFIIALFILKIKLLKTIFASRCIFCSYPLLHTRHIWGAFRKFVNFKMAFFRKIVNFKMPFFLKFVNFKMPFFLKFVNFGVKKGLPLRFGSPLYVCGFDLVI
jgi:hypothetical protein